MQSKKRIQKNTLIVVIIVIIFIALVFLWYTLLNRDKYFEWNSTPNNIYSETIVMAADIDYPPFSFINDDDVYSGHDVE